MKPYIDDEPCLCGTDFTCLADHDATVWCFECGGAVDVVEAGWQADPHGDEWWVRRLDCGHEESAPR